MVSRSAKPIKHLAKDVYRDSSLPRLMGHPQKQTTSVEDELTVKIYKPQKKMSHHKGKSSDINIQENICSPPN